MTGTPWDSLRLIRLRHAPEIKSTFGVLVVPRFGSLATVERDWRDVDSTGAPWPFGVDGESCVPVGEYVLKSAHSHRFGRAMWHLEGRGVTVRPQLTDPKIWRSNCMFHVGNRGVDVSGCVALGRAMFEDRVYPSAPAVADFDRWLHTLKTPIRLSISNAF